MNENFWTGKRVFITGIQGLRGMDSLCLQMLGAIVLFSYQAIVI